LPRLRFNAFVINAPSHVHHGQWRRPDTRATEYATLAPWLELATLLERARFDAIFFADVMGTYDVYRGSRDTAVREGAQFPINDPSLLVPAMAVVTEHLGFAFTSSVLQEHPYSFARRVGTLDHLTDGRVAWNVVTSYLESAARNLGHGALPSNEDRYARAEEYLEVVYKLLEGSWEDGAVVRDRARGVYADPAKVHDIDHRGRFYPDVVGPQLTEPSPQRTPVLFQAGASERGREFAARHAEAVFIGARDPRGAATQIADMRARAARHGRDPRELVFFQGLTVIVGSTEEEARRKAAVADEFTSLEGYAAQMSGHLGIDLSRYDLDAPIGELEDATVLGFARGLTEADPDRVWLFRDVLRFLADRRVVGTPEQVAAELDRWAEAGVGGINLMSHVLPGSVRDFAEHVTPLLQERGLQQREYAAGTLREKLLGAGPRLGSTHPGAGYRTRQKSGVSGNG
jgi:long-chain alkane monooxygenase